MMSSAPICFFSILITGFLIVARLEVDLYHLDFVRVHILPAHSRANVGTPNAGHPPTLASPIQKTDRPRDAPLASEATKNRGQEGNKLFKDVEGSRSVDDWIKQPPTPRVPN